jgi:hypothetical protein
MKNKMEKRMKNRTVHKKFFLAAALAFPLFIWGLPAAAQFDTDRKQQTFDYDPDKTDAPGPRHEQGTISSDYADTEMITDPVDGVFLVSKNRWKSWVSRAVYLILLYLALIAVFFSLPKTEEANIIISYTLSGACAVISFWVFLCAWLLFSLNAPAWPFILVFSLLLGTGTYFLLMKLKRSDISLTELRASFQKMSDLTNKDQRLISIDGQPGDWSDKDFLR